MRVLESKFVFFFILCFFVLLTDIRFWLGGMCVQAIIYVHIYICKCIYIYIKHCDNLTETIHKEMVKFTWMFRETTMPNMLSSFMMELLLFLLFTSFLSLNVFKISWTYPWIQESKNCTKRCTISHLLLPVYHRILTILFILFQSTFLQNTSPYRYASLLMITC